MPFPIGLPLAVFPAVGPAELLVILGIAVLIFGGRKLPELGKGIGEGIKNFKQALRGAGDKPDEPEVPRKGKAEQEEEKATKA